MKDKTFLIKLSEDELNALNDGWFNYVYITAKQVSKSEYIRIALQYMNTNVRDIALGLKQIKEV